MSNNDGYYARFASFEHDAGVWNGWSQQLTTMSAGIRDPHFTAFSPIVWISAVGPSYLTASAALREHLAEGAAEFEGFARKLRDIEARYEAAERAAVDEIGGIS